MARASVRLQPPRCVLAVVDLAATVAWYRERLGFAIHFETEGWCFLQRDGMQLMLGHCPDQPPASAIGDHSYFAYVEVDAIDALHAEFRQRGASGLGALHDRPWGMREFALATPDGHRLMFGQALD